MKIHKSVYGILLLTALILPFFGIFLFYHLWGSNFVHGGDTDNRYRHSIYFETIPVKTVSQASSLFSRIDVFFIDHPEYNAPSDAKIHLNKCQGCDPMRKLIHFKNEPVEIYQVEFSSRGTNYINGIYYLKKERYVSVEMESLNDLEKERALSRLKTEVLDKYSVESCLLS